MQSNPTFRRLIPHLIAVGIFIVISSLFCYPVLQGDKLLSHDTYSWMGMSKESRDYYQQTGENSFWANNMFSGMPQSLIFVSSKGNWFQKLNTFVMGNSINDPVVNPIRFFLFAMIGFYILMCSLKAPRWLNIIGAIAFAFSSYNPIIIAAGHGTKMLDIAFLPGLMAGIIWAYQGKYWKGGITAAIFLSVFIMQGHYQIIFYSLFLIAAMVIAAFVMAVRKKKIRQFLIASAMLALIACLVAGTNTTPLMMTQEYNKYSMRGGESELTNAGKEKKGGLDKTYAFTWSNGIEETLLIMVPNLFGGTMQDAMYWGAQQEDGTGTPIYFGAIICFLTILSLSVIRSRQKWWFAGISVFFMMLSWGKHFPVLNYFLFDHFPLFNKFRSPNMAMAIPSIIFPMLAMWGLKDFFEEKYSKEELWKKLKLSLIITGGLLLVILISTQTILSYKGAIDDRIFGNNTAALETVKEERQSAAAGDAFRGLLFVLLSGAALWAYTKGTIRKEYAIAGLGLLIAFDEIPVANRYLNKDNYTDEMQYEAHFIPRPADAQILKDPDPYYRVFDVSTRTNTGDQRNVFNDASSSLFHKCIGGYHAAKLEIYQDLIEHQIGNLNSAVLSMLNTKYIIQDGPNGQAVASQYPLACGNAWFVSEIKWVKNADEEMNSLNAPSLANPLDSTMGKFQPLKTAIIRESFKNDMKDIATGKDSASAIKLLKYSPRRLEFESKNAQAGLAVFSDIWYPEGWTATIDGKKVPILRADYVLRALQVPAGDHIIKFSFDSKTYYKGERIALICSILLLLFIIAAAFFLWKKREKAEPVPVSSKK